MRGLGRVFNVIENADDVDIPLTSASAITYVCADAGSGDQVATITEVDSTGTESPQALDVDIYPHVGSDVGGTWTAAAEQDDTFDMGGSENPGGTTLDTLVFTITGSQLSDGYDSVNVDVDAGTCVAILHDLTVQRAPANL
jgi:NADPH-dependent ferric siderophore reductase